MRHAIAIALCLRLLICAPVAQAGAWLEPDGGGFLSSSLRARPTGGEIGTYAAYGVTPNLTFGIDINRSEDAGFPAAHALVFARLPLRQRDEGWQLALELGAGVARTGAEWAGMQRVTLSAGRGLDWSAGGGWVSVDLSREWRQGGAQRAWKLDGTLGVHRAQGPAPMIQLELYQPDDGEMIQKLLPALRWQLSESRDLVAGLEWRSFGDARLGLKLELWHRF